MSPPFGGNWRGETGGRSRRGGATVLVRALTECGQPAGVRAAETRDIVPSGSDGEARVLVERPHRIEQTPRSIEAVGVVDANVAGVRTRACDVRERTAARIRVDRRVEQ